MMLLDSHKECLLFMLKETFDCVLDALCRISSEVKSIFLKKVYLRQKTIGPIVQGVQRGERKIFSLMNTRIHLQKYLHHFLEFFAYFAHAKKNYSCFYILCVRPFMKFQNNPIRKNVTHFLIQKDGVFIFMLRGFLVLLTQPFQAAPRQKFNLAEAQI